MVVMTEFELQMKKKKGASGNLGGKSEYCNNTGVNEKWRT